MFERPDQILGLLREALPLAALCLLTLFACFALLCSGRDQRQLWKNFHHDIEMEIARMRAVRKEERKHLRLFQYEQFEQTLRSVLESEEKKEKA